MDIQQHPRFTRHERAQFQLMDIQFRPMARLKRQQMGLREGEALEAQLIGGTIEKS